MAFHSDRQCRAAARTPQQYSTRASCIHLGAIRSALFLPALHTNTPVIDSHRMALIEFHHALSHIEANLPSARSLFTEPYLVGITESIREQRSACSLHPLHIQSDDS